MVDANDFFWIAGVFSGPLHQGLGPLPPAIPDAPAKFILAQA